MFEVLTVGEKYKQYATMNDSSHIELLPDGALSLAILMRNPTRKELDNYKADRPVQITYKIVDDICYFVYKFGENLRSDSPLYLSKDIEIDIPELKDENQGLALQVLVFDSYTGKLCHIRLIGLEHELSSNFIDWLKTAKKLNRNDFMQSVMQTYKKYTSDQLAAL